VAQAVSILLDQELLALARAVGELRRRNLPVESIAVGPTEVPGVSCLTVILNTNEAAADMTAKRLNKLSGVLALVKVRVTELQHAELLDVCELFKATVVDETPDAFIVQVTGTGSFILAFIRALERFGILEVARGGSVALPRVPSP